MGIDILPEKPLTYLLGQPQSSAVIRECPEDFVVDENLGFDLSGEGEHLFLLVRKRRQNTQWVVRELAKVFAVKPRDVSVAGLKDRHAVTTQWISIHMPGKPEKDWIDIDLENVEVLQRKRHHKKLRRGAHKSNQFKITLRQVEGVRTDIENRLNAIQQGVPNYFGEQRFGIDGHNITMAKRLFANELKKVKREKRSMYLSAARSWLFNSVLSQRLAEADGLSLLTGDVLQLDGSGSVFTVDEVNADLQQRLSQGDVQITGPLWGKGELMTGPIVTEKEAAYLSGETVLRQGLENAGLKPQRRPLLSRPQNLSWMWQDETSLVLEFSLGTGIYATSILREVTQISDATVEQRGNRE